MMRTTLGCILLAGMAACGSGGDIGESQQPLGSTLPRTGYADACNVRWPWPYDLTYWDRQTSLWKGSDGVLLAYDRGGGSIQYIGVHIDDYTNPDSPRKIVFDAWGTVADNFDLFMMQGTYRGGGPNAGTGGGSQAKAPDPVQPEQPEVGCFSTVVVFPDAFLRYERIMRGILFDDDMLDTSGDGTGGSSGGGSSGGGTSTPCGGPSGPPCWQ